MSGESVAAIYARNLQLVVPNQKAPRTLIDNASFEIKTGEFVAIVGLSGCGKSTLLRSMAGVQNLTGGALLLAGYPVETLKREFPLAIGYLPQFGAFHEDLTVDEILSYTAALRLPKSVDSEVIKNWVSHIATLAGLDSLRQQRYTTLSGGQRRRIALAEELIGDPPFLFLDELTSGLDPHSELEMMVWLRELSRNSGKTICLVTHSVANLHLCDEVMFLDRGRLAYFGSPDFLLEAFAIQSVEELYSHSQANLLLPRNASVDAGQAESLPSPQPLKTAKPPGGMGQFFTLLSRQLLLFKRDRSQLILHLILVITFPLLVVVFATGGLPQVRNLSLAIDKNILNTLQEQLLYMKEAFFAASLISGLVMFQVILLTLMGANNGSREIAKERQILFKELRAGLSPAAYVLTKLLLVFILSLIQSVWMGWFVKKICGFPGEALYQISILFAATFAMSASCLAISASAKSPERASLLAIYLVGLQLPLSGAVLALPDLVSWITRPFIAAYWGWSGYIKSFASFRHYDIVKQSTDTYIASVELSLIVLTLHVVFATVLCWYCVAHQRNE